MGNNISHKRRKSKITTAPSTLKPINRKSNDSQTSIPEIQPESENNKEISCKFDQEEYSNYKNLFQSKFPKEISKQDLIIELSIAAPTGNAKPFAELAFNIIDNDHSGTISEHEFLVILSVVKLGTKHDVLFLIWRLIDADEDGSVTKEEMESVLNAVNEMLPMEKYGSKNSKIQCEDIFKDVDENGDNEINIEEFFRFASGNKWIEDVCEAFKMIENVLLS